MSRPVRCRKVCSEPNFDEFMPVGITNGETIVLTVDEYEVIRLIDLEKQTQEECAKTMQVSRTTITAIYEKARYKIADSLINGKKVLINGGNYRICDGNRQNCWRSRCIRETYSMTKENLIEKGELVMRIAVTYENGEVFQHFGHTEKFKFYDVVNGKILNSQVVDTNGQGHGALTGFLSANQVDLLICGGIGGGAQAALLNARIRVLGGVSGNTDQVVNTFLEGNLIYSSTSTCSHHENEKEHECGEHGCGNHDCHK